MNFEQVQTAARLASSRLADESRIRVCIGPWTHPAAADVLEAFSAEAGKKRVEADVIQTGSLGYYHLEPFAIIEKPNRSTILYNNVTPQIARELVKDSLVEDNPREDLAFCSLDNRETGGIPGAGDIPLFSLQNRMVLRNCAYIDPGNINHYILRGQGYEGLSKALAMEPDALIDIVDKSGLRDRSGAGTYIARQWRACREAEGREKYVICNAVDRESKARTARLLLESDPHSVLEGILISAYALGASRCLVYVEAQFGPLVDKLRDALEQMRAYTLLGDNILGSAFSAQVKIREAHELFKGLEDAAFLRFLEETQHTPDLRHMYPGAGQFAGSPYVIHNVETMPNVAAIAKHGAEWFSGFGVEKSRGTRLLTVIGNGVPGYSIEVPFGTTLREVVENTAAAGAGGRPIKAVQFGGPAGPVLAPDFLDIPVDYDSINEIGSFTGSGTIEIFYSDSCAVEIAKDAMSYIQAFSCGKCVFCREGSYQMFSILEDISNNVAKPQDIDTLIDLGENMKSGCLCSFGRIAPTPVLSSIKYFSHEYDAHIKEKRCVTH